MTGGGECQYTSSAFTNILVGTLVSVARCAYITNMWRVAASWWGRQRGDAPPVREGTLYLMRLQGTLPLPPHETTASNSFPIFFAARVISYREKRIEKHLLSVYGGSHQEKREIRGSFTTTKRGRGI